MRDDRPELCQFARTTKIKIASIWFCRWNSGAHKCDGCKSRERWCATFFNCGWSPFWSLKSFETVAPLVTVAATGAGALRVICYYLRRGRDVCRLHAFELVEQTFPGSSACM
jgi:hypothetical protein